VDYFNRNPLVEMTEKILDLSVITDKKLIAAEGAAHFWWDKDFYYIDKLTSKKWMKLLK
jgi:hypothetical protein